MAHTEHTPKYRRRTAAELLASIPGARPRPAYACRRCGTIGCEPEQHEPKPMTIPLVARLMA
jgi:hypothetical protein